MVIVPLMAEGEVLGTLNIGRMGGPESHYGQNEFELTKLFAAQAAIALRQRRGPRRGQGPGRARRADRACGTTARSSASCRATSPRPGDRPSRS